MSPADLPWWGWMLCAIGAFVIAFFSVIYASTESNTPGKSGGFASLPGGSVRFSYGWHGVDRNHPLREMGLGRINLSR
jgi:hypothetical protein